MAKEYAKSFYKSIVWQKCRDGYISSVNGLCEECLSNGRYRPGYIVHHIKHITPGNINDPEITLNWDNLSYLCFDCHQATHFPRQPTLGDDYAFNKNGDLVLLEEDHGE